MKTLEKDIKLSVKEKNNNFVNLVNLGEKIENLFPELKDSSVVYPLLNDNMEKLPNEQ